MDIMINGMKALESIDPCVVHRLYEQAFYRMRLKVFEERSWEFMRDGLVHDEKDLDVWQHSNCTIHCTTVHRGTKLADVRELSPEEQAAAGGFRYALSLERTAAAGAEATAGAGAAGGERLEVRARWLVGADGFFSRVRRQVGDGVAPEFSDAVVWWGNVTPEDLAAAGADWPMALRDMDGLPCVATGYMTGGQSPIVSARYFLALRATVPDLASDMSAATGGTKAAAREKSFWVLQARQEDMAAAGVPFPAPATASGEESPALARALAIFTFLPEDVRSFLAATKPETVTERGLYKHPWGKFAPGGWANGRGMVLVGDAAHAAGRPNGQSANSSFEDAAVLATCVKKHGLGDEALAAYEGIRQKRIGVILGKVFGGDGDGLSMAERLALLYATSFDPLWSPTDLPVPVASTEEGLAWSRARVREIVKRRMRRADKGAGVGQDGKLVQK